VQMLVMLGEHREARLWADKALELFSNNGELLAAKAQACARLSDRRASFAWAGPGRSAPSSRRAALRCVFREGPARTRRGLV
jgi:hypothetical protein